jgi:hypothetical protein
VNLPDVCSGAMSAGFIEKDQVIHAGQDAI